MEVDRVAAAMAAIGGWLFLALVWVSAVMVFDLGTEAFTWGPWWLWRALGFDWDEVTLICTALAGATVIVLEWRRVSRLDDLAVEFGERLARLEANSDDSVTLEARLVALEAAAQRDERLEERISNLAERVARVEMVTGVDQSPNLADRVTAIEHGTEEVPER